MTNKIIFGLTFIIHQTDLSEKDLLADVMQRTAKCLQDKFWLWQDIKQFSIKPTDWDSSSFEIFILFNNFYTEKDLEFFVKECAKFGNADVYPMEIS